MNMRKCRYALCLTSSLKKSKRGTSFSPKSPVDGLNRGPRWVEKVPQKISASKRWYVAQLDGVIVRQKDVRRWGRHKGQIASQDWLSLLIYVSFATRAVLFDKIPLSSLLALPRPVCTIRNC